MNEDKLYIDEKLGDEPFRFDDSVARVFPDMLRRSIPGYAATLEAIGSLAARYVKKGTHCYDLGCSLGAATLAMLQGVRQPSVKIIAVDNSEAMIDRATAALLDSQFTNGKGTVVSFECADIQEVDIGIASMVVLNYTLQFIPLEDRGPLISKIYEGMLPGGILVLSEKVVDEDAHMEELLVELHHEHKRRNNYSELEISRKRAALENVLVPETVADHRDRLAQAGFRHSAVWLRNFNFVSIVAIR